MPPDKEIDFARYAEVSAYLRWFPADKRDEVIGRLGHDKHAWNLAAGKWAAARDAELLEGSAVLTERFGNIVGRTMERLALERPTLESLGPLPPEAPPPPEPAAEPAPPEAVAPPEVQRSSAQLGLGAPPPELPSFLARPSQVPIEVPIAPSIVEATPPARVTPAPSKLAGTLPLGTEAPRMELPFQQGPVPAARAIENAIAHAAAVQGPAEPRNEAPAHTGTVGVGTIGPAGSVLPFEAAPPPGCPELTLPQYASLRVELHLAPERADTILARYGVAAGARAALEAYWRTRFEADPLSRMEFTRAYATYLGWARQQAGQR
jgi:hypothetical protein